MPAPQCASCHKARAALRRPRSGQALCTNCFCAAFEAEVLHTVVAGRLLPPGAVVAVELVKDKTGLGEVLSRGNSLCKGPEEANLKQCYHLKGHRAQSLVCNKRGANEGIPSCSTGAWCVPLSFLTGSTRSLPLTAPRYRGVSSRRPAGPSAPSSPARVSPPGHNADDMAETVLMNFLRGDAGRLARGGGLGSPGEGGALPRCRPLQLASQKEVVLYAHFRRLDYFSEECVYAPEAFRGHARDLLKLLEAACALLEGLNRGRPRLAIGKGRRGLDEEGPPGRRGSHSRPDPRLRSPSPASRDSSSPLGSDDDVGACALLEGLNRGRPRLAIGKGRRGLDEEGPPGRRGSHSRPDPRLRSPSPASRDSSSPLGSDDDVGVRGRL
ncbi:cytoplasmic tRNA 2-thiolation protein 1 [Neophocaena asiaeorientalis asiaeorientalis]|uniref:Cytoplasmic tRNA 2-thiolation protein 1 n=1 Tax=Neophocaena asiaeorientalis asiaeorientalis TaxID=1706337 RepID=A0A341DB62_NEOAA|nr:cytoplasmic tRNA 2-thiolation protein 1 [Neophocaena asiaeorientalis asiaeorientalis]